MKSLALPPSAKRQEAKSHQRNFAVRYVAEPKHVREVSLLGSADFGFWNERLRREELVPVDRDGRAQILITAGTMQFMAIRFTEVSFAVLLAPQPEAAQQQSAFLIQTFNSSRLFAWCERVLFATPYLHADCRISVRAPVSIQLAIRGEVAFHAKMRAGLSGGARQPSRVGEDGWKGTVFLPRTSGSEGRLLFARLSGYTRAYPFVSTEDRVTIAPPGNAEALQTLIDSHFTPQEWLVREHATHGKSKTYKRSEMIPAG